MRLFARLPAALAVLALLTVGSGLAAQEKAVSSLEKTMGSERFRAAGLDQQTPEQLQVLEEWIRENGGELAAGLPASEAKTASAVTERHSWFGRRAKVDTGEDGTVRSRIAGAFGGWNPGSVLVLENGQKWRIKGGSALYIGKIIDSPAVTVSSGLLGGWNLQVEGYNTTARVVPAN